MTISMTGFAARRGQGLGWTWAWELRAVNGKGQELRLRVPEWIEGLEAGLRSALAGAVARGNVTLSLRLNRESGEGVRTSINHPALEQLLASVSEVDAVARARGLVVSPVNALDLLGFRGVLEQATQEDDHSALRAALLADFAPLLADFTAMRASEGAALAGVIAGQLNEIERLVAMAQDLAHERRGQAAQSLHENVARLMAAQASVPVGAEGVDAGRLALELALLAVKSDVTEELDRLGAHILAARALLAQSGAVGRKFDFLTQEFMREANTLCSKAQSLALTQTGLDLKTVIDQMREQIQNVE